jgi:hypothetical protein
MTRLTWFHLSTSTSARRRLIIRFEAPLHPILTNKGVITLFSELRNCVQIILGASHDNGYARLLRQLETDGVAPGKVALLEGPRFAWEIEKLIGATFPRMKFAGLFNEQKLGAGMATSESGMKYSTVAAVAPGADSGMKYSAAPASGVSDGKTRSPTQKTAVLVSKSVNPDTGIRLYGVLLM